MAGMIFMAISVFGQYKFEEKLIPSTSVKNQQNTGTCWSFSTTSFLEAEVIRLGGERLDLSEMFNVYYTYQDKAENYVLRQGKANFGQGALAHDVLNAFAKHGAIPQAAFDGRHEVDEPYDHSEFSAVMKGFLDGVIDGRHPSPYWKNAFNGILNTYMGAVPEKFEFEGKSFTPQSFAATLPVHPEDYVTITSFSHHPFYSTFILEIPDNFSNHSYYNVPLEDLEEIMDAAMKKGCSVAWDGDVGEKGFSQNEGLAVLPVDASRTDLFEKPGPELAVTQVNRQLAFESYSTTDDHLMHAIGTSEDQDGNQYYVIKNSWGAKGPWEGLLHMSKAYFRMKTVAITLHKDAIPKDIARKMFGE